MNTRRGFLQASSLAIAGRLSEGSLPGQETPKGGQPTRGVAVARDYWNDFPNYLISAIKAARSRRKSDLSRVRTTREATERASFVSKKVWELIGGQLEKTPLNARTMGTIERESYRIEKLIFESQPQFYVPAHLYVPKSGKGPFPAIISPLGHTPDGKLYKSYQTVFQNLARQGFVVFTWTLPAKASGFNILFPERTVPVSARPASTISLGGPLSLLGPPRRNLKRGTRYGRSIISWAALRWMARGLAAAVTPAAVRKPCSYALLSRASIPRLWWKAIPKMSLAPITNRREPTRMPNKTLLGV